jgi:hypothetical protein
VYDLSQAYPLRLIALRDSSIGKYWGQAEHLKRQRRVGRFSSYGGSYGGHFGPSSVIRLSVITGEPVVRSIQPCRWSRSRLYQALETNSKRSVTLVHCTVQGTKRSGCPVFHMSRSDFILPRTYKPKIKEVYNEHVSSQRFEASVLGFRQRGGGSGFCPQVFATKFTGSPDAHATRLIDNILCLAIYHNKYASNRWSSCSSGILKYSRHICHSKSV